VQRKQRIDFVTVHSFVQLGTDFYGYDTGDYTLRQTERTSSSFPLKISRASSMFSVPNPCSDSRWTRHRCSITCWPVTQFQARASFWSPSLKSQARTRHLFLEPDWGPRTKFTEWVKTCETTGYCWRSKVNVTKQFTINHFCWRFDQRNCFNSNWRQYRRHCEKILFPAPKCFDKLKPEPGPTREARPDLTYKSALILVILHDIHPVVGKETAVVRKKKLQLHAPPCGLYHISASCAKRPFRRNPLKWKTWRIHARLDSSLPTILGSGKSRN